jgi:hypothetical protein
VGVVDLAVHHGGLLAEAGEDVTLIKAKSCHRSLRSLERYVNPSNDAVARLTDRHGPNRRAR